VADETIAKSAPSAAKSANAANPNKFTMYIIMGLIFLLIMVMVMATLLIMNYGNQTKNLESLVRKAQKLIPDVQTDSYGQMNPNRNSGPIEEFGLLVPLNEMIVNLTSSVPGEEHYLKVNVTLEVLDNEKVKEEIAKRVPQLRDLVISKLRMKTKDEIDEKEGKEKLGGELLNSINSIIGGNKVRHVFFEDFMIQ
jgi:flagellar basal body-associated protein FliL